MAHFQKAFPYADDAMNLPVNDLDAALPFYETVMGFKLLSRSETPNKSAVLGRDDVEIGLAENGGDPTQEGCFFRVDDVESAFAELKSNGLNRDEPKFEVTKHGDATFKQFFIIAPDGLCYCVGERQE